MKKVLLYIASILFLLIASPVNAELTYPKIYIPGADAYVLMEVESGKILAEYQSNKQLYPASTTKIITAILAIENGNMNQEMVASQTAVFDIGKDGMNIGIQAGEIIKMKDLLNAMLIVSANEIANILAENISGTREEFMKLVNEKAKEIGAENTNFTNPSGMHQDNHYTTALDLGKISCYAMRNDIFRSIVKKTSYNMPATNKHTSWNTLYTSNILLRNNNFDGYEITGVKSGYTNPAGRCLITSAKNADGVELIAVVMGVRSGDTAQTLTNITTDLFKYGFNNFKNIEIIGKNVYLGLIEPNNARDKQPVVVLAQDDLTVFTLQTVDPEKIEHKINLKEDFKLPVKAGDVLGEANFYYKNELLGTVNIIAGNNVYTDLTVKYNNSSYENKPVEDSITDGNETNSNRTDNSQNKKQPVWLLIVKFIIISISVLILAYITLVLVVITKKKLKKR